MSQIYNLAFFQLSVVHNVNISRLLYFYLFNIWSNFTASEICQYRVTAVCV